MKYHTERGNHNRYFYFSTSIPLQANITRVHTHPFFVHELTHKGRFATPPTSALHASTKFHTI